MNDTAQLDLCQEPGVYYGMAAEDYHKEEAMSASGAKAMLRSPQHYRLMREKPSEPTAQMNFGTAVHCGVLEADCFDARIVRAPEINRLTKDGKAAWTEFKAANAGRIILSHDDHDRVRRCVDAVLEHPTARELLEGARREVSLFWSDAHWKVPCKARYDALNGGIVDLKTTADASPEGFARQAANLLYHVQGAHYFSGGEHVLAKTPEFFVFICVESDEPHAVACYSMRGDAMMAGARLMDKALELYRCALELGEWPGYPPEITTLAFPQWDLRSNV